MRFFLLVNGLKMVSNHKSRFTHYLGKHYIQYVSHQQATRVDVARLREMLDQKLMER